MSATGPERRPTFPPFAPTVPEWLRLTAAANGARDAIVRGPDRISYAELERRSAELARGLLAKGIGKGARVGLLMPNSPDFAVAFMALGRIGALACPFSTLYQAPELRWVLHNADVELLLVCDRYLSHDYMARLESAFPTLAGQSAAALALPEAPFLREIMVWGRADRGWASAGPSALAEAAAARPQIDAAFLAAAEAAVVPADLLCMIHTSGSTADPKGVVHSHGGMIRHSFQKSQDYWMVEPGERVIAGRPWFWIAGLAAVLFQGLQLGACIVVPEGAVAGEAALALVEREGATAVIGDEALFKSLRDDPVLQAAGLELFRLSNEVAAFGRRTADGARFLNPQRAARWPVAEQLPDALIPRSYGMTETISSHTSVPRATTLLPAAKPRACGQPMPGVSLRIVDPETGLPSPTGEVGEIWVRSYSLMQGLYKKEREETFSADGFYPTGDLGRMDADGFLHFASRMGEMIKISGANVAPIEVEICLTAMAEVERAAVVPLRGAGGATVLAAAVQLRPGAAFDAARIQGALREQLSSYKVPRHVFALAAEAFPMTGSGKIKKSDLIALLQARLPEAAG